MNDKSRRSVVSRRCVVGSAGPCSVATTGVPKSLLTSAPMARPAKPSWSWMMSNSRARVYASRLWITSMLSSSPMRSNGARW